MAIRYGTCILLIFCDNNMPLDSLYRSREHIAIFVAFAFNVTRMRQGAHDHEPHLFHHLHGSYVGGEGISYNCGVTNLFGLNQHIFGKRFAKAMAPEVFIDQNVAAYLGRVVGSAESCGPKDGRSNDDIIRGLGYNHMAVIEKFAVEVAIIVEFIDCKAI